MTAWLGVVHDSRKVHAIYGDEAPSLRGVSLHEVAIHRDGPNATLRVDLPTFPSNPPKKWADRGLNVVQVELSFASVSSIKVDGWTLSPVVDLSIGQQDNNIIGSTSGDSDIYIKAASAIITSISAYRDQG